MTKNSTASKRKSSPQHKKRAVKKHKKAGNKKKNTKARKKDPKKKKSTRGESFKTLLTTGKNVSPFYPLTDPGLRFISKELLEKYTFTERNHACAILKTEYRKEWNDILYVLEHFWLTKKMIQEPGGRKSPAAKEIDGLFQEDCGGWEETTFDTKVCVNDDIRETPTHKIDNYRNGVGVEVEWNNKPEFYDRDLNNFRLLYSLHALSVGVIITRLHELQPIFNKLGKGDSYGASTTQWNKLIPKIDSGGAGGCPLLIVGMGKCCTNFTIRD